MAPPEGALSLSCDLGMWFPAKLCVLQSSNNCTGNTPHTGLPSPPHSTVYWVSTAGNSSSSHETSGSEVCSCSVTGSHGKCWLGQGKWDEKAPREEKWCGKKPKSSSRRMIFLNCFWSTPCWKLEWCFFSWGCSNKSKFRRKILRKHSQDAASLLLLNHFV